MHRIVEERVRLAQFDDAAQVHHPDPVAHVAHRGKVVGDQQIREVVLLLQVDQEVHDLGADRDVERRYRLVQDDQLGVQRKRTGDADALALAARELVRVQVRLVRVQPDLCEQVAYTLRDLGLRHRRRDLHRLADDRTHPHPGVQR